MIRSHAARTHLTRSGAVGWNQALSVGNFELIYDEALSLESDLKGPKISKGLYSRPTASDPRGLRPNSRFKDTPAQPQVSTTRSLCVPEQGISRTRSASLCTFSKPTFPPLLTTQGEAQSGRRINWR